MKQLKAWSLLFLLIVTLMSARFAFAHQPWFEDFDFTPSQPYLVRDATVSTAVYSTLWAGDRDYFQFEASAGQAVMLDITIPKIDGLAEFAHTMRVLGPGLDAGGYEIPPIAATEFYEPFSGTTYWDRQEEVVSLAGGTYTVEVWHPAGVAGRYVFVIGTRETGGGDPAFSNKMRAYWTPLSTPEPTAVPTLMPAPTAVPTLVPTEVIVEVSAENTPSPTQRPGLCRKR